MKVFYLFLILNLFYTKIVYSDANSPQTIDFIFLNDQDQEQEDSNDCLNGGELQLQDIFPPGYLSQIDWSSADVFRSATYHLRFENCNQRFLHMIGFALTPETFIGRIYLGTNSQYYEEAEIDLLRGQFQNFFVFQVLPSRENLIQINPVIGGGVRINFLQNINEGNFFPEAIRLIAGAHIIVERNVHFIFSGGIEAFFDEQENVNNVEPFFQFRLDLPIH